MSNNINHGVRLNIFLWFLLLIIFAIALFISINNVLGFDEFESLHASWKVFHGEKIYVDFFEHHHPLLYYMLIPIIAIFKETIAAIIASRIFIFILVLLIFAVTYYICSNVFDKKIATLSLVLLSFSVYFFKCGLEIRPDIPQVLCGLCSISFLIRYFKNHSLRNLLLSSAFSALSFLFLQKAISLILIILALLVFEAYQKRIRYTAAFIFVVIFFSVLAPFYFYLLYTRSMHSYFMFNWQFNSLLIKTTPLDIIINSLRTLKIWFSNNLTLWLFWLIGILFYLKTPLQKKIGVLSVWLLITALGFRTPHIQYLFPAIPLISIIATEAFFQLLGKHDFRIIIVAVVYLLTFSFSDLFLNFYKPNKEQLKLIKHVISITDSKDFVYDPRFRFNIFRKDIDFFGLYIPQISEWLKLLKLSNYSDNAQAKIKIYKPTVISDYLIGQKLKNGEISGYRQLSVYEDIFIRID